MKQLKYVIFILSFILCIGISGCKKEHEHKYIDGTCSCGEVEVIKYTVTFVDYDGTVLKTETVEKNHSATSPTAPSREGYDFTGWSAEFNNVTSNLTVIAQYKLHEHKFIDGICSCGEVEVIKYTVIWKNYDGTVLEVDDNVISGTLPSYDGSTPIKASDAQYSYVFSGWSPTITEVASDVTYVATYTEKLENVKISFELNGGTTSNSTESIYRPSIEITDFFFDVHKEGYNFRGWSYDGKRVFDEKGNKLFNPELKPSMTFTTDFAQDVILNITTNIPNAGSVTGDGIYAYNTNVDVTATPNQGYSFVGWYYNGILLSNQKAYRYMMWSDDSTLEARFIIESYNLRVESVHPLLGNVMIQGSSIYKDVDNKSVQYLSSISIAAYTNTEEYRFLGWYDINGELVTTNAVYTFVMKNYDYELYAKWDAPSFNVNVINDDNKGNIDVKESYEYNSEVVIEATANSGYTFEGWYIDNIKVSSDTTYSLIMPYNDVTLEARWEIIVYNITYFDGEKILETNNPSSYTTEHEIVLENIIKDGYTGTWLLNDKEISKIEKGTTEDLTLSVLWHPNKNNLTVISENEIKGVVTIILGSGYSDELIKVNAESENGYTFEGWYINEEKVSSDITYSFTMPYNDVTLEARWEIIVYNITYFDGEKILETNNPSSYTTEHEIVLENIIKDGYTGTWLLNDKEISKIEKGTTEDLTLSVLWHPNKNNLTVISENEIKGVVTIILGSGYSDELIKVNAESENGYTFEGWYIDNIKVSSDTTYSFIMPYNDVTLEARWFDALTIIDGVVVNCTENIRNIVIPNSANAIGDSAFYDCTSLTSITIPEGVTSIGDEAFYNCNSLTSITIPECVTSIGDYAFYGCDSLTSITIPEGVTSIGDYAFSWCISLTSITIPEGVTSIGDSTFYHCDSLTSITIPNSVTSIGKSAFYDCTSLTSITIPNSVTSIGDYAFSNCKSMTSITIPNSVTSIGDYAFSNCKSMTSITIPDSVTSIGGSAFSSCSSLIEINVHEDNKSFKSIDGNLYSKDGKILIRYASGKEKTLFEIPNTVTNIGDSAFSYCASLTSITIPNSVTSIGGGAFYFCTRLTSIIIPESVTSIGGSAFSFCLSLTSITIPDSVTSIGGGAFFECTNLTSITIPNSVTSIGESAFKYCTNLTSITIPNSVTSIGDDAFYDCENLTSLTIPDSVTSIGESAFGHCDKLTSITIPDSVISIGDDAFYDCSSLTNITIPDSVTSIGDYAFHLCNYLTIYCEIESQPDGWSESWNASNRPIYWGYNIE